MSDDRWLERAVQAVASGSVQTEFGMPSESLRELRTEFARFQMSYRFGIEEIATKVKILRQEFESVHSYSPIEHVRSRLKSPESLLAKVVRVGCEPSLPAIRERVRDIAGIRITCSFESDVYWIASMLTKQPDITVVETRDYIAEPKPNGYRSLRSCPIAPSRSTSRSRSVRSRWTSGRAWSTNSSTSTAMPCLPH